MAPKQTLPWFALALAMPMAAQDPAAVARLRKDVAFLASAPLKGRGNGEPGLDKAAAYLRGRLQTEGLHPRTLTFSLPLAPKVKEAEATLIAVDSPKPLERGRDYEVMGWSGSGGFPTTPLLVFATGLRVHARDEVAGHLIKDRVVVIPRRVPESAAPGTAPAERSLAQRLKRLEELKPAAVLVLEEGAPARLQREEGPAAFAMPVLSLRKGLLEALHPGAESGAAKAAAAGEAFALDLAPAPWLGLGLKLELEPRKAALPNLVAEVPGTGGLFAAERIVVGAHMDHLGLGERHSLGGEAARGQVHAGADDNASGSALVVELARRFKKKPLRRTVLVALFGGEEEGLLGSRALLDQPPVPLKSLRFMANFDMVGRLDPASPRLLLGAYGAPESAMKAAKALAPAGWSVSGDLGASVGGSDHMSFAAAGIPTFFFFTGLHSDYHRPTDTADKIDAKGMALLADYAEALIRDLDAKDELPAFDPSTAKTSGAVSPMKASLGTLPDYGTNPLGFRINGVSKGGAAEAAGLKGGDILTHIGGREVKDVHGYMAVLSDLQPGVPVKVRFLRDGQAQEILVTPKGRN
jgi:hypothetical protein